MLRASGTRLDRVGRRDHSDIGVTMNVYTHLGLEDAAAEMARLEEVENARKEQEKIFGRTGNEERKVSQKTFRVV